MGELSPVTSELSRLKVIKEKLLGIWQISVLFLNYDQRSYCSIGIDSQLSLKLFLILLLYKRQQSTFSPRHELSVVLSKSLINLNLH